VAEKDEFLTVEFALKIVNAVLTALMVNEIDAVATS
jgi:hypothetical protein